MASAGFLRASNRVADSRCSRSTVGASLEFRDNAQRICGLILSRCQYCGDDLPELCVLHLKPPVGMSGRVIRVRRNHQAR
jgi:hypothetical protein